MRKIPEKYMKKLTDWRKCCTDLTEKEINEVVSLGNEITMQPKRKLLAKGAVFFIEGNEKLSLDRIQKMAESKTKYCDDDAKIFWGAEIKSRITTLKITAFYVY